jgi:hypothetical protein
MAHNRGKLRLSYPLGEEGKVIEGKCQWLVAEDYKTSDYKRRLLPTTSQLEITHMLNTCGPKNSLDNLHRTHHWTETTQ